MQRCFLRHFRYQDLNQTTLKQVSYEQVLLAKAYPKQIIATSEEKELYIKGISELLVARVMTLSIMREVKKAETHCVSTVQY